MDRKANISESRLALAIEAGKRWQARAQVRSGTSEQLQTLGPVGADSRARTAQFEVREELRRHQSALDAAAGFPVTKERRIGPTLDFTRYAPDEEARQAGRPVARIVEMPEKNISPEGFGSGFLVSPRLLMTNHHVLPSLAETRGVGANFNYEYVSAGLQRGPIFELDPDGFYISNEPLDFALVAVNPQSEDGVSLDSLGFTRLIGATGKILIGHPVNIIQYPDGGPKQYATTQNKLLDVLETGFLHYSTDTLPGSSGSPAFNQYWEIVALHHQGVPMLVDGKIVSNNGQVWDKHTMSEDDIQWVANEGVRVSFIVDYLSTLIRQTDPGRAAMLDALLRTTADPLQVEQGPRPLLRSSDLQKEPQMGSVTINVAGNAVMYINSAESTSPLLAQPVSAGSSPPTPAIEEKALRFDKTYKNRKGFDPMFLSGFDLPLPEVDSSRSGELLEDESGKTLVLKYHHFSLVMNRQRRLQMWSAVNVDYSPDHKTKRSRKELGADTWIPDPRIAAQLQIQDDDFYQPATKIDRGHIVRREDNAWGATELEIEYANADTFHWTNCTPQHERFNRETLHGLWGQFETYITNHIGGVSHRAAIFAGPVLDNENDPGHNYEHGYVQYPLRFWKVIAGVSEEGGHPTLQAYGFVFDQSDPIKKFGLEAIDFGSFKSYQKPLSEISKMTGIRFPQLLLDADVLAVAGAPESIVVDKLADIRLRR